MRSSSPTPRWLLVAAFLLLAGCDYRPRETFKIKTADGREIELTCPVVDSRRSTLTYIIDGHCVIEPRKP